MNNKRTEIAMSMIMQPNKANPLGTIHGGEIMKFLDNVAGALSGKYSKGPTVTARVDEMQFHMPVAIGNFVTGRGMIAYVGNTSMEVAVTLDVEDFSTGEGPKRALSAFFTMVAIDSEGRPRKLEPLTPETPEELRLYQMAKERRAGYKRKDYSLDEI